MTNCVEFLFAGYLRVAEENSDSDNVLSHSSYLSRHTLYISCFLAFALHFTLSKCS